MDHGGGAFPGMIRIDLQVDPALTGPAPQSSKEILHFVLASEGVSDGELTLIFATDEYLRGLKKEFFQVDQFTDVLAFRLNDYGEPEVEGEIYISLPRARDNAAHYGEPYGREVARLIIHGGLHLLDYRDEQKPERERMRRKEEHYLNRCPWSELFTVTEP